MPSFKVKIKWGKEKFDDVLCNTDEEPILFKVVYHINNLISINKYKLRKMVWSLWIS